MSEPLLEVNDVNLSFGGVSALTDVSFTVHAGETFAIIGPNGAGKSSLLNVLTGIYRPSSGSARIAGQELVGRRPHHIAHLGVSRTFQNLGLFDSMSVFDNVLVGRSAKLHRGIVAGSAWWGPSRREEIRARRRCAEILDLLGLADLQAAHLGILPYGTKKRVELAKALASDPRILLLDEPVAGMNPEESAQIAHSIEVARAEMHATVVLIEHDLPLVMSIADTVLVMDFGKVIAAGEPAAIQSDPEVLRAYTGDLGDQPSAVVGHPQGA